MLGQGHEVDVAVDRRRHAKATAEIETERGVALLKNWALSANPGARSTAPGRPTQMPEISAMSRPASLTQAAHAVFHQVGDDGCGLPIDADRQRERAQDVGAE